MVNSNGFRQGMGIAFKLGLEMAVATALGGFIGYGADQILGTKPWGLVVGIVLGSAGGMLNVYRAAMQMTKELEEEEKKTDNPQDTDEQN